MGLERQRSELLLVEDQPILRTTISTVFHAEGFNVTTASNLPEAISLISAKKFDLLVSDLNIDATHDGLKVIAAMKDAQPEALTFILTATPDAKSALWAVRNNVDDYFAKSAEIHAVARRLMERVVARESAEANAAGQVQPSADSRAEGEVVSPETGREVKVPETNPAYTSGYVDDRNHRPTGQAA